MLTHSQLTAHVNPIVQNRSSGSDSIQLVVLLSLSHQIANSVEKAMAPHSSTLAWKIPWMDETGRLQSMGFEESDTTERLHFHFSLSCIGEGNGNSLHCSCLENPRDGGAWWAAVYGVAQSRTWLKWLSSSSNSNNMSHSSLSFQDFPLIFDFQQFDYDNPRYNFWIKRK